MPVWFLNAAKGRVGRKWCGKGTDAKEQVGRDTSSCEVVHESRAVEEKGRGMATGEEDYHVW